MKRCSLITGLVLLLLSPGHLSAAPAAQETVSLDGRWQYRLDREDVGIAEGWFDQTLNERLKLPGSLPGQGIGDPVTLETKWIGGIVDRSFFTDPEFARYREPGEVKVPFWLQPETYYAGVAWYQREIELPAEWVNRRVRLVLERPHWETRVWLNDRLIGTNNSLSVPHDYDLGVGLASGKHTLTIRVDNRMVIDIGENSHSISDHTQGNWNGIVGRIELQALPLPAVDELAVYPEVQTRSFRIEGRVTDGAEAAGGRSVEVIAEPLPIPGQRGRSPGGSRAIAETHWTADTGRFRLTLALGPDAPLWDEFQPARYRVTARVRGSGATRSVLTGLREISAEGTQFLINGRPLFFRGTLDCCIYPKTGHPPTDVAGWKKVIGAAQAHGLNHIRFHSWCPPEAAFAVADELGFYFQVEAASWANQSTTLGDGRPVDRWIYEETERILSAYGNHPSFVLMAYGNEPGGGKHRAYLAEYVEHYRARDPRRLWTSGAGWPQLPENQWHSTPDPRIQAWGGGLSSRINGRPPETRTDYREYIQAREVPVISHEIGQWCVYPNLDEMKKYTGYLKPRNFEIFRDRLREHGLVHQARAFLHASGKLQTLCYKEDIESALRTPGMGGFQLLDLHDFPGQGTALVGVLDPFWEEKGYVAPAEFRRFCNTTVPLARLDRRVFTTDQLLRADIEVSHAGPAPLNAAVAVWRLVGSDGKTRAEGELPPAMIPLANAVPLGTVQVDLAKVPAPAQYRLVVGLAGTRFENDWDVWVYPPSVPLREPEEITITSVLDESAAAQLAAGGRVLLLVPPARVAPDPELGRVALGFSSIFWNTAWTGRQPPHTLGILCDPKHALFAEFPTEGHSNWQWWYLVSRAGAMILDDLPRPLQPTVQVVDDWFTARKLGLVFEARVGSGKLVVCSIDLEHELAANPVARQLRHSLLRYMQSRRFKPRVEVAPEQIRRLFLEPSPMQRHGARIIGVSSAEDAYGAARAIDGDPRTIWHSQWSGQPATFPHELVIGFPEPLRIAGFNLLPRQDNNRNGWIKDYAIYVGTDGIQWGDPVAQGTFPANAELKSVTLTDPVTARFVRLVALSGHANGPWASLAELEVRFPE